MKTKRDSKGGATDKVSEREREGEKAVYNISEIMNFIKLKMLLKATIQKNKRR